MGTHTDLNGIWSGMYDYQIGSQTVKFTAWLDEDQGRVSGTTNEPNTFLPGGPDELSAVVKGGRNGLDVSFSKVYAASTGIRQPELIYDGEVNANFTQVNGIWRFRAPGYQTGRFALVRLTKGMWDAVARLRAAIAEIELQR